MVSLTLTRRKVKSEGNSNSSSNSSSNGLENVHVGDPVLNDGHVLCSPSFTDVIVVTFSYTIDTDDGNSDSIQNSISQLESLSLDALLDGLVQCHQTNDLRLLSTVEINKNQWNQRSKSDNLRHRARRVDALNRQYDYDTRRENDFPTYNLVNTYKRDDLRQSNFRYLSSDVEKLGIVGLSSLPRDEISTLSNCFPTYLKSDTCNVVYGKISAYLTPSSNDEVEVSSAQKGAVERRIRYTMMQMMKDGRFERKNSLIKHTRYLSPIVLLDDEWQFDNINASNNLLDETTHGDSASTPDIPITQSILIIAACFIVMGIAGLLVTLRLVFAKGENLILFGKRASSKPTDVVESSNAVLNESKIEDKNLGSKKLSIGSKINTIDEVVAVSLEYPNDLPPTNSFTDARLDFVSRYNISDDEQKGMGNEQTIVEPISSSEGNDWGTTASMPMTMRRLTIIKKASSAKARDCGQSFLCAIEEDEEQSSSSPKAMT